jgi:hypothetical protein
MTPQRQGFALLLVLAATLVVTAAATLAISLLWQSRRQVAATRDDDHLCDALAAGERIALAWIITKAQRIQLPLEGGEIPLVDDHWHSAFGDGSLTVHLYDGCAMIPARCVGPGGSLQAALPNEWSAVTFPAVDANAGEEPPDWLELALIPAQRARFPNEDTPPHHTTWSTTGSIAAPPLVSLDQAIPGLAQFVNPHSEGAINLNTAAESLLAVAFNQAGIGGLDEVLRQRRRGHFITAAPQVQMATLRYHFVTTSSVWCAHITAHWNNTHRSWWVVIAGNLTKSRIVQRHDADR